MCHFGGQCNNNKKLVNKKQKSKIKNVDVRKTHKQGRMYSFIKFSVLVILSFSINYTYSQSTAEMLEKAYKKKSTKKLKDFFYTWSNDVPPIADLELSEYNDTIQQAYKSFISFYKPHRLDSIEYSEWGNEMYKDVGFLIVQNTLKIYFTDKVFYSEEEKKEFVINEINRRYFDRDSIRISMIERLNNDSREINIFFNWYSEEKIKKRILTDSIMNFRPSVFCNGKIPVFLNETYKEMINAFLGNKFLPLGAGGIMNPARAKGQSEKRKRFLENYVKIFYGHWGGYWQLYSYPQAYSITFDNNMEYARINFRVVYEGGEAFLKNENGVWTLISSKLTWIE